tara:strand:- start:1742 stop:2170 length:429 start_codon:yes stop_codon:yes gene_type:complete
MKMTKNYKILTSYIQNVSSSIKGTEDFIYLKDNIPKFSLGIDINTFPLKNNMAEVHMKLTFDDKNTKDKKAFFEMTHATVIRVEESAVNKDELKKIFLSQVPTDMYPEVEKKFFEIVKLIGYPEIKLGERINFQEQFEKNQK